MARLLWRTARRRGRDRWTRAELAVHQERELRRLRAHAYARSAFYRRFHRGHEDRPLHELPVLTKALLMEHFDELLTDPAVRLRDVQGHLSDLREGEDQRFLGRYRLCATSGSTGRRGLFLFDPDEWVAVLASFARAREWAGLRLSPTHRMRTASVASTASWHLSARAGATLQNWWTPALRLSATEPLATLVARLNAWQPEMLVAYASVARLLAEEQQAGRLRIAPHLVFTSSEVLTPATRRRVERVWDRRLFDQYAATEGGGLAAECTQHRGLHLFEDLVLFEVVDERNRPVPPGEYGAKLLITVLASRTQPLIRYEVTDSVRLATEPCPCGRPFALLEGIQGRAEEVLHLPGAAGGRVAVHPHVIHRVLDSVPAGSWQVRQEAGGLTVLLSGGAGLADEAAATALRRELADLGASPPPLRVRRVAAIPRTAAGKAPLVTTGPATLEVE